MVTTRDRSGLIVGDPGIQGGEPIIRGTRLPVRSIGLARDDERRAGRLGDRDAVASRRPPPIPSAAISHGRADARSSVPVRWPGAVRSPPSRATGGNARVA
jgi:hypothetical protein